MKSDVAGILHDLRKQGKRVLFEGAQGALLDIDHGTYPYVTSSNTTVGGALAGSGVGADSIDYVLGIAKAYATRVGGGPFPTELDDEVGQGIRDRGAEYGASTGRPRRCGWMDIVALKRAVAINGISGLCITKLDVLDGMEKLKVCIAYEYNGKRTEYAPLDAQGWEDCTGVPGVPGLEREHPRHHPVDELPPAARAYLRSLEELAGCPISIVSTGPDRDHTMVLQDPFA
jgi:adenylosuccinate synthase